MHDLKFAAVCDIPAWDRFSPSQLQFSACAEVSLAFRANIVRTHSLTLLPGYAFMHGEGTRTVATKEAGRQRFLAASKEAESSCCRIEVLHGAFHDLLKSIVIQTWAAFEALSEDLLLNSKVAHPECFAHLKGAEKFRFRRVASIQQAYDLAFAVDSKIQALLNGQCVHALSLIRHLLVHKLGIVDDTFRTQCANADLSVWRNIPKGQKLTFSGDVVRSLVDPITECGFELIRSVDDWLTKHRPTS